MEFRLLRTKIPNWHFCRAKSAQMFNLFTRCVRRSAMLCKRPQDVFPLLGGSKLWIELLLRTQSSDALSNPTTQNSLSPLETTLAVFHQSKPSIKHPASSLSLFKRICDVAVWLHPSDTLQSAVRTNNNVYEF